jgi:hypothetical protein
VRGGEEGSYHLLSGVGVELADVEAEVVAGAVHPDGAAMMLQRSDALVDELQSNHGPRNSQP